MRCLATLVVFCAAASAVAAPAPFDRPESGAWYRGWGEPTAPVGDWRLSRNGPKLSLVLRAAENKMPLTSQRLLRAGSDRSAVTVRVTSASWIPVAIDREPDPGKHRAGLVLTCGERALTFAAEGLHFNGSPWQAVRVVSPKGAVTNSWLASGSVKQDVWLRLACREDGIRLAYSFDNQKWHPMTRLTPTDFPLDDKIKYGVFAESTAADGFDAHFDWLRFSADD